MPKKAKARGTKTPAKKSASRPAKRPAKRSAEAKRTVVKSVAKQLGIDPRVIAAIGLALEDERVAHERGAHLDAGASGWVSLARARGVRPR